MKHLLKSSGFVLLLLLSLCSTFSYAAKPKSKADIKQIIPAMQASADDWNKGNLEGFLTLYDPSATFMMPTGPVGMEPTKEIYQKYYFNGKMPKQNLSYSDMVVRPLGDKYALLTGAFLLTGNNLPERKGRYTLVFVHTEKGWKILHDHSS